MMRPRTMMAGGVIVLAVGAVAMTGLPWLVRATPAPAPGASVVVTAEIIRGPLRDTKTVTGTLSYGDLSARRPSGSGASTMVTWIAPIDSIVERGAPLYRLDGQPTLLLYGSVPHHRTLRFDPDSASAVWVELERAQAEVETAELTLRLENERLADAETRAADTAARLSDALAEAPVTPQFVQLVGAVRAAGAKVARVKALTAADLAPTIEMAAAVAELAAARAALDAAIRALRRDHIGAELDAVTAKVAVAEATTKRDTLSSAAQALAARESDDADVAQLGDNLAALGFRGPLGERVRAWQRAVGLPVTGIVGPSQVVVATGPVHIAAHGADVGDTLLTSSPEGEAILTYSSTLKQVTVPLAVADRELAAIGRAVTMTLPDDRVLDGTIAEVGSVVTEGSVSVTVTIADQAALGGLEVASVDVGFVSEVRDDVLSVPITALLARPEGGFAVEVVTGGASRLVPVHTGLFAAGRVEVSGEGIAEGLLVGVPG